jgi:uncharacterized protein (UPF0333 family)
MNKRGQSATEYILILAVMVAIIVVVARYMPDKFRELIDTAMKKVEGGLESVDTDSK